MEKKKKSIWRILWFSVALFVIAMITYDLHPFGKSGISIPEENHYEEPITPRPAPELSDDELAYQETMHSENGKDMGIRTANGTGSYANGQLKGTWNRTALKAVNKQSWGYRVKGTLYDQTNDVVYAMNEQGHLYRVDYDESVYTNTTWELLNNRRKLNHFRTRGFNRSNGSFRIIEWNMSDFKIKYSDDEGKNWANASGLPNFSDDSRAIEQIKVNGSNVIVAVGKTGGNFKAYHSTNDGTSYTASGLSFSASNTAVLTVKPHNTEDIYLLARNSSNNNINHLQMGHQHFELHINKYLHFYCEWPSIWLSELQREVS